MTEKIGEEPANMVNTVTYNLAIFPAEEHMKDLKKQTGKNTVMKLDTNEPFDTWKAPYSLIAASFMSADILR